MSNPLHFDDGGDFSDISTRRPVLAPGQVSAQITNMEVLPNNAGDGKNLVFTFKTTAEHPNVLDANRPCPAGHEIRTYVGLQNRAGSKYDYRQRCAEIQDNLTGSNDENRPPWNSVVDGFNGMSVVLTIKGDTYQGNPSASVQKFVRAA